ncbi:MAG: TetR/AcrR family transcriptional regulator [Pseudomonadota bacterium]|uniref:TetR/AcrR family transcriptional regulator n=1 Tax=Sphingomonas sp. ERG5 TaxID=1381597 RepID=UPI00068D7F98|nr:TetR/AcrR family transcriptional regulator [Sphingomonas sp. ERG5]
MIPENPSFITFLKERLAQNPPQQKGTRTRERLKIAAAEVLEEKGYLATKAGDIAARAGVAEGSFYIYFKDKTDSTITVLTTLLDEFILLPSEAADTSEHPFKAIRRANRRWIAVARANPGLMRCVLQLGDENADFAAVVQRTNRNWFGHVARRVVRRRGVIDQAPTLFAVYLLGAMMDELLRKLIVYPDRDFLTLLQNLHGDDEMVADATSVMWLRVLYPNESLPRNLPRAVKAFADAILPG